MKKRSPILEAVHNTAKDLYKAGAIDEQQMKHYDILCMADKVPDYSAEKIKSIRERLQIS